MSNNQENKIEETRQCQNKGISKYCSGEFVIDPEDFVFYEKIKVPPPTFCPECRMQRRMSFSNERVLYLRKCDFSQKNILSMFSQDSIFPVYDVDVWYGDSWDAKDYAMDYDFSRPFFDQFKDLLNKVPRMSLVRQGKSINSLYAHRASNPKNSYMAFRAISPEDCSYVYHCFYSRDCVDCSYITKCELCYECVDCENSYRLIYSQESINCRESAFLYGCSNCYDCIGCVNLVNSQFCIENVQYSKEEYFLKKSEMKLNQFNYLLEYKNKFKNFRKKFPQRATMNIKTNNSSGNWLINCENVKNSFGCHESRDVKHSFVVFNSQDCMDYYMWGAKAELIYESANCGIQISNFISCNQCWTGCNNLIYCDSCMGSSYLFGCVGLKKDQYCILNKQYTKEEYFEMVEKIKKHMMDMPYIDKAGRLYKYGEFFPTELSLFSYNETAAKDFYSLNAEETKKESFNWKNKIKNLYTPTLFSKDLSQSIDAIDSSITKEIIECASKDNDESVGVFRITEQELVFYKKIDLPLPRDCFDIRLLNRLKQRPELRIIERNCYKCNTEVKTIYSASYAPMVYCEKCYQQEVY